MVTVYDKEGVKFEKQSVDARECVEVLGWTYDEPEIKKPKKARAEKAEEQESQTE